MVPSGELGSLLRVTCRMFLSRKIIDARHERASKQGKDDLKIIVRWLGVESADKIGEQEFEQFGQAFERYLYSNGRANQSGGFGC